MKKTKEKAIKILPLGLAKWAEQPEKFSRAEFAIEVTASILEMQGAGFIYDLNLVTILADQMETYVKMSKAIQTEDATIMNSNGSTGINPKYKIRDMVLTKILSISRELSLSPSSRSVKKPETNDVDDLLAGPQL